jgi:Zn-dependent peptidase ImmA (M78 family)/transcriptional regulator with XRE-family HTH domain
MDKIKINPNRLQWCCDMLGISLENLSQEVGIAYSTLESVIDGDAALSVRQLEKLAAYFNRSLLFFLERTEPKEEKIYSVQFRTINNQKPIHSPKLRAFIERVEKQREIYLSLCEDLGETVADDWYPYDLDISGQVTTITQHVRQWLGLGEKYDFEQLRESVESKGVMVVVSNGYNGKWQIDKQNPIRGFSLYYDRLPIIVIKKQRGKGAQAFTLMHELAHLLLHKESMIDEESDFHSYQGKEKEANEFAGNVLVPIHFLNQIDVNALRNLQAEEYDAFLKPFKNKWCVSGEVILIRLLRSQRISQYQYNQYREFKKHETFEEGRGTRQSRFREPANMFGQYFVNTVLDALHSKNITLAKASTYLDNLKIRDIHKLEGRNV